MKEKFFKKFEGKNSIFSIQLLAMVKCNEYFGDHLLYEEKIFSMDHNLVAYIYQSDVDRIRKYVFDRLSSDPDYLKKVYSEAVSDFEKFKAQEVELRRQIDPINSPEKLKRFIRDFVEFASFTTRLGFVAELFVGYEEFWPTHIGISKEDFAVLTTPQEPSFTKEFDYEIAKLKLGLIQDTSIEFAKKYYWVRSNYNVVDLVDAKYIEERLVAMSRDEAQKLCDSVGHYHDEVLKNKEMVQDRLKLSKAQLALTDAIGSFILLQDKRKEIILRTNSIFLKAANKLLDMYEVASSERDRIISSAYPYWFSDLSYEELLIKSKEAFTCIYFPFDGGEIQIGKKALEIYEAVSSEDTSVHAGGSAEVVGRVAYTGKVRGRVAIILKGADFAKFKDGEVLITSMTRPEFVPLMQKAVAVVTDEGGVTCHAAIVSRELKIPCIIGTKIATKVFKDGDMVEVDAEKGIVKKLNN